MLILSGYQPPNIVLDIQPGGNHVIEDSHKKVCHPSPVCCRAPGRAASQMSGQEHEGGGGHCTRAALLGEGALC